MHHNSRPSTEVETPSRIYLGRLSCCLHPNPIRGLPFQSSISIESISSTGILTCCPSYTLFSLYLGPTNPWMTAIAMETLDIQRAGFSPALRYSSQHSHFYMLQRRLTSRLHSFLSTAKLIIYRTLLYHSLSSEELNKSATSESIFSPVNFKCKIS